ncbi:DUF6932 family protein [Aliarcobacter butzleri]|uniref:DUF6932 family protein n=1 Tax=Aliarcobacter butzleri TaxID=28197 RepID=UPI003B21C5FE
MGLIPEFENGFLPKGIHDCSGDEFIERFCNINDYRKKFIQSIEDIFDFAKDRNAKYVFIGGSFITEKEKPSDFDVVIVFSKSEHIPRKTERILIDGNKVDIMFCSEDKPDIVNSFIRLFSSDFYGREFGFIQVNINNNDSKWVIKDDCEYDETYEIVKRLYTHRQIINLNEPEGILVTIHGILSNASWNNELMPIASSQGWIVAPFYYGYTLPDILMNENKRKEVIERFREWILYIQETYNGRISVIAHSFGTYILASYLNGFDEVPPVTFNSIILTGSIVNTNFDWNTCRGNKVSRVRNEIAPNDQWVKWMPETKWLPLDKLFGKSGTEGFVNDSEILTQPKNDIFDHNNVIKKDVITQMWMPYLNANKYAYIQEERSYFKKQFANKTLERNS